MNVQKLEQEIVLCRHILQTIALAKQLCKGTDSYMSGYLTEVSDRTAVQISLLQEILSRADEFTRAS